MRELKFRAWDGNKMHYLGTLERASMTLGGDQLILITHNEDHIDGSEPLRDLTVMQYTGLKDINGKEIWEGDLVRDGGGYVGVVEWEEYMDTDRHWQYATGFLIDMRDGVIGRDFELTNVEVIGNLYEHPELAPKN